MIARRNRQRVPRFPARYLISAAPTRLFLPGTAADSLLASARERSPMVIGGGVIVLVAVIIVAIMFSKRDK
jgi:hypothetical protein